MVFSVKKRRFTSTCIHIIARYNVLRNITIRCRMKWRFVRYISMTFTFDISCKLKHFVWQSFTFFQCGSWICMVSVKTWLCALCSYDLYEWQVGSVHSAPVVLLSPAQLYERCIELMFTLGKMDLVWHDSDLKQMVQPFFHFTMFLYTT